MTFRDLVQIAVAGSTAGFSFGALFVAVRWTANFIAGRLDKKEARLDAGMQRLIDGLKAEVDRLTAECRTVREWKEVAEESLRECERRHADSEARVKQLEATMQGYGDARQLAALQAAADKAAERKERKL